MLTAKPLTAGGWPGDAPGGAVVAAEGWLYDDTEEAWTRLPRPTGERVVDGHLAHRRG